MTRDRGLRRKHDAIAAPSSRRPAMRLEAAEKARDTAIKTLEQAAS
jgi:hypothetical protein